MKYRVFWDLGDLDCRDTRLQRRLGMSMNQIINANDEYMEKVLCQMYSLPLTVNEKQLNSIKRRGYKGFKIYHYYECV
tara:strand:+ start:31 stop:264 length:234 start_codon:yes stop_codon:yes gene_type:complete